MSEEKALMLFAKGWNRGDFSGVIRRLHKKATYEAFNRFYRHEGHDSVKRLLEEKAADLRSLARPQKAWSGWLMAKRELSGLPKCDQCLLITGDDPSEALGVVRIRCSPFRIRDIRILDPAQCNVTRGEYVL